MALAEHYVYRPAALVRMKTKKNAGEIHATILEVHVLSLRLIRYKIAFWSGDTRMEAVVDESELNGYVGAECPLTSIGFVPIETGDSRHGQAGMIEKVSHGN